MRIEKMKCGDHLVRLWITDDGISELGFEVGNITIDRPTGTIVPHGCHYLNRDYYVNCFIMDVFKEDIAEGKKLLIERFQQELSDALNSLEKVQEKIADLMMKTHYLRDSK